MDERQIEQGYANFHRNLNRVLRKKEVKVFKTFIAAHPMQAGRLSRCLGLSDELAEIEMVKAILVRSALKDMHPYALEWLNERKIKAPRSNTGQRKGQRGRSHRREGREK
jgi:hypothetical protein